MFEKSWLHLAALCITGCVYRSIPVHRYCGSIRKLMPDVPKHVLFPCCTAFAAHRGDANSILCWKQCIGTATFSETTLYESKVGTRRAFVH